MNIDSNIGITSKSNYDLKTTSSSQWEFTNSTHDKYTYLGHSYNTTDEEATVDPSFQTDHTPSAQHLCTIDNTTSLGVEPTLSELDDPVTFTSLQPSDVIGKEFASVEDAEAFYKNYSLFVGFSIRKDEMRRDRHGMITIRIWVCSKQGYIEQKWLDKTDKKHEPRGQTREGCRAAMKIKIDQNSMMWVVREFVIEHTHNLSPPNHIQFLRSHRTIKDLEITQLQSWRTVGVKTAQVMDHIVEQSGSYSNVGHTKKDLQNRLDSVRRLKMYEFLKNIDRALDRIRNTETLNDYQCSTTEPVYSTHLLGLEKHAGQNYTRNVFFLVREEIREEASLSIVNCVQDVDNCTYTFKKFGIANSGLPCRHSFSVMKAMDMQHIPSSLILHRWTTRAKDFSAIKYACEATPTPIMEKARYGSLSSKCGKMCYFASKSYDGFKEANIEIDKLTLRMQKLMPSSPIHSQNVSGVQHVHNVKDPSMAATKGSVRRKKNAGVKQRKCGKCGQPGHTAKTCHGNVQTNNSSVSTNDVHMYERNLTQNNDTSYGCSSTGPSYSFTFPVNNDCGGDTNHDLEYGNIGFDHSSSTFAVNGYPWWGTARR
ncbi:hypothetical protein EZV62_018500 [Acer yangbiense]|uniref:CCHC-type domain-containing protein n=1 Tax=Acer yangbiense TaxID=1000413 RepID=A0A5C7HJJ8_9ROSI|nr:hypothetical protein EZV62_018500 [Acer yangbiense]